MAYLSGGPIRAAACALTRLIGAGAIRIEEKAMKRAGNPPPSLHVIEAAIVERADATLSIPWRDLCNVEAMSVVRGRLERAGLLMDQSTTRWVCWLPVAALGLVAALGITKIVVGVSRGHPTGLLVLLVFFTGVAMACFAWRTPVRTRYGDRRLELLERDYSGLSVGVFDNAMMPVAVAVFGWSTLPAPVQTAMFPHGVPDSWTPNNGWYWSGDGAGGCGGGGCGGCGEYRRFIYLAVSAGHPVTPSEQVDQAWHMHLVYTRYEQQYAATLASYARVFGQAPPADIWPSVEQRFGDDLLCLRINTQRTLVIDKRRLVRSIVVAAALLGVFTSS